ncbi:MAG TPA: hypothetical protein VL132_05075 [Planctomycetaceae bacterium]|nr:hypothetical protein [Planctomycetaceae bacterium]
MPDPLEFSLALTLLVIGLIATLACFVWAWIVAGRPLVEPEPPMTQTDGDWPRDAVREPLTVRPDLPTEISEPWKWSAFESAPLN